MATIVCILLVWLALGCVMDAIGMIVLTLPIVYPIVLSLGFDPIWFSVLGVIMVEAGLVTPPVGMNLYVISGIARDVPIGTIFRGVIPYVAAILVCVFLLVLFPEIALFLPEAVRR
jgi:TRAP-type C4-dicarboxylate transport system permease large subunit